MSQTIAGLETKEMAFVHITRYEPDGDKGDVLIHSLFDAMGGLGAFDQGKYVPLRNTVHTTLNHPVAGHMYGNWDDAEIAIIAPFDDVLEANGPPAVLNTVDTFWALGENTPLKMRNGVTIVPSENLPVCEFLSYKPGSNKVHYKRTFSEEDRLGIVEYFRQTNCRDQRGEINLLDKFCISLQEKDGIFFEHVTPDNVEEHIAAMPLYLKESFDRLAAHHVRNSAIYNILNKMGCPVMPGGMWAWGGDWGVTADTNKLAEELGCNIGPHSGTDYALLQESIGRGNAKSVDDLISGSQQLDCKTKQLGKSVLDHPTYKNMLTQKTHKLSGKDPEVSENDHPITLGEIIKALETSLLDLEEKRNHHDTLLSKSTLPDQPNEQALRQEFITSSKEYARMEEARERHGKADIRLAQALQGRDQASSSRLRRLFSFSARRLLRGARVNLSEANELYIKTAGDLTTAQYAFEAASSRLEKEALEKFKAKEQDYLTKVEERQKRVRLIAKLDENIIIINAGIALLSAWSKSVGNGYVLVRKGIHNIENSISKTLNEAAISSQGSKFRDYINLLKLGHMLSETERECRVPS